MSQIHVKGFRELRLIEVFSFYR